MNKNNKKKSVIKGVINDVNEIEDNNNNIITTNINNTHNEHEFVPNTNVCKINNNEHSNNSSNNSNTNNELLFQQIFPQITKNNIDFTTYEEYENYLARMKFTHEHAKSQNSSQTAIMPKHIDKIIIHEEE